MQCYDDRDEQIELFKRAIEAYCPADDKLMENREEYCEMMQFEEIEDYWRDAENNKKAPQWDD